MKMAELTDGQRLYHTGYVAVAGRPNVGKSTLINHLLQFKLSITTPKPQTTRHRIMGILTGEDYQIIFLDTPGLIDPTYRLQEVMMRAARRAVENADVVLFIVDATDPAGGGTAKTIASLDLFRKPVILVINKIDLVGKSTLLPLIESYQQLREFAAIVPVSARSGENTGELLKVILPRLPAGEPFFAVDQVTQHSERFFVSELIREKIFGLYGEEIPYSTAVVIDEFKEARGAKDYIKARIVVERSSQKAILIGKKGAAIHKLGEEARREIEGFLGRPVFLELWVAVREKWRKNDLFLREFGYGQ